MLRTTAVAIAAVAAVAVAIVLVVRSGSGRASQLESVCYGTPSRGALENGVQIAASGANFSAYSRLGVLLGRTYAHSKVTAAVEAAYKKLEITAPSSVFVYGETGWRSGGRMRPHRTHQNGLAVDFLVPVLDSQGRSVALPTSITNEFGYGIEFDAHARYQDYRIDFDALSAHLIALDAAAREQHIRISRVIFEKQFLPLLFAAKQGEAVRRLLPFMQGEPWIRHDEHYHVDFAVPCQPLARAR